MRPSLRCLLLFAAGIPVGLLPVVLDDRLWVCWLAYVALALLLCGADIVLSMKSVRVKLGVPDTLYVGSQDPLRVAIEPPPAPLRRAKSVELIVDLKEELEPQPLRRVELGAADTVRVEVPLVPRRRGTTGIEAIWIRWTGPFGLVRRQMHYPLVREVPVVPDVRAVRQAALRFFTARQFLAGLKVERYIGDGTEFDSLREYVPGLDHRAMNWKASARHRTLYCTEYRAERNHQVVVALDTGHLMCEQLGGLSKLDRAINAGLLMSYVCMRTGDRVGWFTFDAKVRSYTAPDSGAHAFRRLQQVSSEIGYSNVETNFTLGLAELSMRLKRRSLVVLLTDFVDTITAELMIENLARLSRRHFVLFVTLRDPKMEEMVERRPATLDDVYRSVVAGDFERERDLVLRRLGRLGVRCIDAPPERITTSLLNSYLDAKRRELF